MHLTEWSLPARLTSLVLELGLFGAGLGLLVGRPFIGMIVVLVLGVTLVAYVSLTFPAQR